MDILLLQDEDLQALIPRIFEEPICTQLLRTSNRPTSLHVLRNPFNTPIEIQYPNGDSQKGDKNCFLGVDPNRANLSVDRVRVYIIPEDPNQPGQPQDYSAPNKPTPH